MSYTPPEQEIDTPREKAGKALIDLDRVIMERIYHSSEWNKSHIFDLKNVHDKIVSLLQDLSNI